MPYSMRENADGSYRVVNSATGEEHSKHTTKKKAKAQLRLLHGVDSGWKPTHKFGRRREQK